MNAVIATVGGALGAGEKIARGHNERAALRAIVEAVGRVDGARGDDFRLLVEVLGATADQLPDHAVEELLVGVLEVHCERRGRVDALLASLDGDLRRRLR